MDAIRGEQEKLAAMIDSAYMSAFREAVISTDLSVADEMSQNYLWPLPSNTVITTKGRKIVGRDPNISSATLNSLLISESVYLTDSFRSRLNSSTPRQIAEEEFLDMRELGATHLALCIEQDLRQTKADLIANYSDDRRLPFVVGAIYIDAYMRFFKPYYYSFYPHDGYLKTEWKPRRIYIQPRPKLPPKKHDFKKYYKVGKMPSESIIPCPVCGNPGRLLRTGFRGKEVQVCCSDPAGQCRWYLGAGIYSSEIEAIKAWNEISYQQRS